MRKSIAKHESSGVIQFEITDSFIRAWQDRNKPNDVGNYGLLLRGTGVLLSAAGSLLISYRVNIDGKMSFYGIILRIMSFTIMAFIFACDSRFTAHERVMHSVPKLFGIGMAFIQLYGIIRSFEGSNILLSI
jgi:hypothetical protein